jgi:anti-sigma factor RsiW
MTDHCLDAIPLLGPRLDGELPAEDAAWLDEHVQGCVLCQERKALLVA